MAEIFVCWDRADEQLAHAVVQRLKSEGHHVLSGWSWEGDSWSYSLPSLISDIDIVIGIASQAKGSSQVFQELVEANEFADKNRFPMVMLCLADTWAMPKFVDDTSFSKLPSVRIAIASVDEFANEAVATLYKEYHERKLDIELNRSRHRAKEVKRRQIQKRVEAGATEYIRSSLDQLSAKERYFRRFSILWYLIGIGALISGVGSAIFRASLIDPSSATPWTVGELVVLGVAIVWMLIAISKYAFTLAKSYMVESLRNADRAHAISFGEFYMKSFGDDSEWDQIKEVFQHWNIDKGSAFIEQKSSDFDPKLLKEITKLIESVASVARK